MRKYLSGAAALLLLILAGGLLLGGCRGNADDSRHIVYEDMKESFDKSGLLSANIGLFSRTEKDGSVSYGEGGSGVIFKRDGNTYYALTAAHVVSVEGAELLVYTVNTEMKTEEIPGVTINVLSPEVYDTMYAAEAVYVSARDDLAVVRFSADEELAVVTIADADPRKGDRILCVGNPQNDWFALSYGEVTSGMESFGEAQGFPSNVMKHSAYIQVGSSGGAALNEQMQLVGTVPGGSFSLDGKTFRFGVLIPAGEIKLCLDEWDQQ